MRSSRVIRAAARAFDFRPTVVLVHEDAEVLEEWKRKLGSTPRVLAVQSLRALDTLLEENRAAPAVDVVVFGEFKKEILERGKERRRLRFVHCGPTLPDGVVDAAAEGFPVSHVDRPADLWPKVSLVAPRRRTRTGRRRAQGLSLRWAESKRAYDVLDLSLDGLAFLDDCEGEDAPVLPGTTLKDVEVVRDNEIVMLGIRAVVRHVLPDQAGRYRIGCELRPAATSTASRRTSVVTDKAQCAALVRLALHTGGISLANANEANPVLVHCEEGTLDASRGEILFAEADHSFSPFDALRGSFQFGGSLYRFVSTVKVTIPLTIGVPSLLEEVESRGLARHRTTEAMPVELELATELLPKTSIRALAHDISGGGVSFDLDPEQNFAPLGTRFRKILVRVGGTELEASGRVVSLNRINGRREIRRCGIEFEALGEAARVKLADALMRSRFGGIEDPRDVSFDEIRAFFRDAGFLPEDKEAKLGPVLPEIRRVFETLHARPTKIFKSIVARDEGRIVGHVSGIRAYQNTWMSQHLAALPGKNAAHLLNLAASEFFGQVSDLEYFKIWFFREANWPSRIFGGFARKLTDPHLSELAAYAHFLIPTDARFDTPSGVSVIEAAREDLALVERFFIGNESPLVVKSDELTRSGLNLGELNASFRKLGLYRRRRVLLALRRDEPVGFALAEVSSPGLNLYEALSSFRIFLVSETEPDPAGVRRALLSTLVSIYRQTGRPYCRGLLPVREREAYEALGLPLDAKQSLSWTCHRSLYRRFSAHVDRFFETLDARRRRKS